MPRPSYHSRRDDGPRACLSTDNFGLAAVWAIRTDCVAGPWKMNRLGRGHHLGAMLQETIENRQQSCRADPHHPTKMVEKEIDEGR